MRTTEYARTGETHVAYQVIDGDSGGSDTVVMVSGAVFPMEALPGDPIAARLLDGLASLGRLVMFDRRGTGQSDPVTDWDRSLIDQWADDLEAVTRATTSEPPVVFAWDGFGTARALAARSPDLVGKLVLFNPAMFDPARPFESGAQEMLEHSEEEMAIRRRDMERNIEGEDESIIERSFPSRAGDKSFIDWLEAAGRSGASPAIAKRIWTALFSQGADTPEGIVAPTLVLQRPQASSVPLRSAGRVIEAIPGSSLVRLEGADVYPIAGDIDSVLVEISAFVTGSAQLPPPQRSLAAVLFTDIVGSTERAAQLGDERWRILLDAHDEAVRTSVARCGGSVVKTTGDGVLARFPSASAALRCATGIRAVVGEHGLEVRVGVHVGEIDERRGDVSGLGVHVAARVMSRAGAGEIWVSASVPIAVTGSDFEFEPQGSEELKGVPGSWDLFALTDLD